MRCVAYTLSARCSCETQVSPHVVLSKIVSCYLPLVVDSFRIALFGLRQHGCIMKDVVYEDLLLGNSTIVGFSGDGWSCEACVFTSSVSSVSCKATAKLGPSKDASRDPQNARMI